MTEHTMVDAVNLALARAMEEDETVLVLGEVPQIVEPNFDEATVLGPAENTLRQRAPEHLREECENVKFHLDLEALLVG